MIYLAAPYTTGLPENMSPAEAMQHRAALINREAAAMMEMGLPVYSPISHGMSLEQYVRAENLADHAFWMRHCYAILDCCSLLVVLCLPGWDESTGVKGEISHAIQHATPIIYIRSTRDLRDSILLHTYLTKALRESLATLINEPQPLGTDRPAYQNALALMNRLENAA